MLPRLYLRKFDKSSNSKTRKKCLSQLSVLEKSRSSSSPRGITTRLKISLFEGQYLLLLDTKKSSPKLRSLSLPTCEIQRPDVARNSSSQFHTLAKLLDSKIRTIREAPGSMVNITRVDLEESAIETFDSLSLSDQADFDKRIDKLFQTTDIPDNKSSDTISEGDLHSTRCSEDLYYYWKYKKTLKV